MFAGVAYLRRHWSSSAAIIVSHPQAYPLATDIAFFGQEFVPSWKPGLACWCDVDRLAPGGGGGVTQQIARSWPQSLFTQLPGSRA